MTGRIPDAAFLEAFIVRLREEQLLRDPPEPRTSGALCEVRDQMAERSLVSTRLAGFAVVAEPRDFGDTLCGHVILCADKPAGEPYTRAELADLAVRFCPAGTAREDRNQLHTLRALERIYLGYPTLYGRPLALASDRVRRLGKLRRALYACLAVEASAKVAALAPETLDPVALRAALLAAVAELGPA